MDTLYILIVLVIGIGIGNYFTSKKNKTQIEVLNKEQLLNYQNELKLAEEKLKNKKLLIDEAKDNLKEVNKEIQEQSLQLENSIQTQTSIIQSLSQKEDERVKEAFAMYVENLELEMSLSEEEFDCKMAQLKEEMDRMKATKAAMIEAAVREQEIREQETFYKIFVSKEDLADIYILEDIKPRLRKPEVLSKLIWTTFYQKPLNTLCSNILGENTVSGIYKITDTISSRVYIGQSTDIAKRWKDHVKCALGASPAAYNKLYSAMAENGVQNFTFELLEKCPSNEMNQKEKYFIELYQANTYGLNTIKGTSK